MAITVGSSTSIISAKNPAFTFSAATKTSVTSAAKAAKTQADATAKAEKAAAGAAAKMAKEQAYAVRKATKVATKGAYSVNAVAAPKNTGGAPTVIPATTGQLKTADLGLYNQNGVTTKPTTTKAPDSNQFVAEGGDVVVDIKRSDSGYNNKIYWSSDNFKTRNYLGIDNETGTYNIGKFQAGTKIEFGIDNGAGQFFRTGAASNNADNVEHAKLTKTSEGTVIGFEDLYGGGDNDFNDAIIGVKNIPKPDVPKVETKDTSTNHSGLGDGTNPGQGKGTDNATNGGTNNPNKASAYLVQPAPEMQLFAEA